MTLILPLLWQEPLNHLRRDISTQEDRKSILMSEMRKRKATASLI
jgi:hypothetical protein